MNSPSRTLLNIPRFGEGTQISQIQCQALWYQLLRRELQIVDMTMTQERCYLVMRERGVGLLGPSLRMRRSIEATLLGENRKAVASEIGIAPCTLARLVTQCLLGMGLDCSPAKVPQALVQLVQAACGRSSDCARSRIHHLKQYDGEFLVFSQAIDAEPMRQLTRAELAVVRERAAGRSYADIARTRRTSPRTVANQIAAASKRLGASGRLDLLRRIYSADVA